MQQPDPDAFEIVEQKSSAAAPDKIAVTARRRKRGDLTVYISVPDALAATLTAHAGDAAEDGPALAIASAETRDGVWVWLFRATARENPFRLVKMKPQARSATLRVGGGVLNPGAAFDRIAAEHTLVPVPAKMDPARPDGALFLIPWPEAEDAGEDGETDPRGAAVSPRQARHGKDVTARVLGDPPPHRSALARKG